MQSKIRLRSRAFEHPTREKFHHSNHLRQPTANCPRRLVCFFADLRRKFYQFPKKNVGQLIKAKKLPPTTLVLLIRSDQRSTISPLQGTEIFVHLAEPTSC
jgi:hypothetical protein